MWFEPTTFPDSIPFNGGYIYEVGFQTPPGGEIGSANHVLNAHTYCCEQTLTECVNGEPMREHQHSCWIYHSKRVGKRAEDA